MKKIVTIFIIIAVVFGLYKLTSSNPQIKGVEESSADIVLYYGDGCPHCQKVEAYINQNQLDQKVKITMKEVYYNKTNQNDMLTAAKNCPEIDTTQGMGVPFAYVPSAKSCLQGDQPIVDWLSTRK